MLGPGKTGPRHIKELEKSMNLISQCSQKLKRKGKERKRSSVKIRAPGEASQRKQDLSEQIWTGTGEQHTSRNRCDVWGKPGYLAR